MIPSRTALLLLACLAAQAQVVVTPRYQTVKSLATVQLTAVVDDKESHFVTWSFPGHPELQAPGGVLVAPVVSEATIIPVVATQVGVTGEGALLVVPQSQEATILFTAMAGGLNARWSNRLPFMDVETSARFDPSAVVRVRSGYHGDQPWFFGYGIPCALHLSRAFAGADAALLTWRDGRDFERIEVTGQRSVTLTLRDLPHAAQVEALWREPRTDGTVAWESQTDTLDLHIRGCVPFAGNTVAEAGHEDGQGISSRFQAPCGVALWKHGEHQAEGFAVADPVDQTIRLVTLEGAATTLCGAPGQAGFQDDVGPAARFRGPTFLATPWHALYCQQKGLGDLAVADTGNHLIRRVGAQGQVSTWAGRPGVKGFKDAASPQEAEFNEPRGLAFDLAGNLYVADAGNHVIRRISPTGVVTTLAGKAGAAGAEDGLGGEARFTDLKGLAFAHPQGAGLAGDLLVADGHAIRALNLTTGQVTTLAGKVGEPGFRDGAVQAGQPCLNEPWGVDLDSQGRRLIIADKGNRAVRALELGRQTPQLETLAGDPGAQGTRWGLLRDGLPDVLGPEYAALEAPVGVAVWPGWLVHRPNDVLVASGRCLGLLASIGREAEQALWYTPHLDLKDGQTVQVGQPLTVTYEGYAYPRYHSPAEGLWILPHGSTFHFLDAATRQEVLAPCKGPHGARRGQAKVVFEHPGKVEVVVACVTDRGITHFDRKTLIVTP